MIHNEAGLKLVPRQLLLAYARQFDYQEYGIASFVSRKPSSAMYDGFERVSWEHNSSLLPWTAEANIEPYALVELLWEGPLVLPGYPTRNSELSVEMILAGAAPWLRTKPYRDGDPVVFSAHTTLTAFVGLLQQAGGRVYACAQTASLVWPAPKRQRRKAADVQSV